MNIDRGTSLRTFIAILSWVKTIQSSFFTEPGAPIFLIISNCISVYAVGKSVRVEDFRTLEKSIRLDFPDYFAMSTVMAFLHPLLATLVVNSSKWPKRNECAIYLHL